jgi:hypothetical protein
MGRGRSVYKKPGNRVDRDRTTQKGGIPSSEYFQTKNDQILCSTDFMIHKEREDTPVWLYNQRFVIPFLSSLKDSHGEALFNQVFPSSTIGVKWYLLAIRNHPGN